MNAANFSNVFNSITCTIEFNEDWNNGTGYYNGAVKQNQLPPGKRAKCVSPDNYRRIVLIGTRFGNAVFFERYTQDDTKTNIIVVSNVPRQLNGFVPSGSMSDELFLQLASYDFANVGTAIEAMHK